MSSLSLSRRMKLKALAVLSLFTLVVMLFVSNDSPLASINNHVDSAIFFMSGKAWANGLIPYVDFSDSKGPLLWFIEMVGYWISPTDYHGVWVLSVLVMSLTFYVCWLTAMAVLHRPRLSMCVAMTMAIPYFLGFSFLETRAETWCNLPVAYGIYLVVKKLIARSRVDKKICISTWEAICLGVSVMSCLLIKYSIAVMMLSLCFSVLILCWYSGIKLLKAIGWFFVGMIAMGLPFVIYFINADILGDFIKEYFMITFGTVCDAPSPSYFQMCCAEIRGIFYSPINLSFVLLSIIGPLCCFPFKSHFKWLLLFSYAVFFAIASYHNYVFYYLQISLSFSITGIIWLAEKTTLIQYKIKAIYWIVWGIIVALFVIYFNKVLVVKGQDAGYQDLEAMETSLMDFYPDTQQLRLLCYRSMDIGVGVSFKSIPATRYWTYQTGATQEMTLDQDEAVREHRADVIYALTDLYDDYFIENGYKLIYTGENHVGAGRARLYILR